MKKVIKNVEKTVDELRPFDDTFMQVLAEDRGFCEELLQVVMDNPKLKVISNLPQKHLHNIDTRSVTVDMLCEDEDGVQFSVEVQKEENDDHQRRVRYNGEIDDGTRLSEYVKLLKNTNAEYNEKFPRTSNVVRYYKLGEGRKQMCKVVEEYAKEYAKEQTQERVIKMAESLIKRGVDDDIIQETTDLSLEDIASLRENIC